MKTGNLNFALTGCGRIAQRHASHIGGFGRLIAACDPVEEKACSLAAKYGATPYTSLDEMLKHEEVDVVTVCSPNGQHAEHTVTALRAGRHVLCEKPMAINVHDCGRMIQEAERANRRLFIVKQNRFNPPVAAVKKAIDEGRLGRLFSVQVSCFWNRNAAYYEDNWKGTLDQDGGTLFTQFSHFVDLLYWLIGDVKKVNAFTANFNHQNTVSFEDTGAIALEFYSGVLGTVNYTVNSYGGNMEGSVTLFAEKGTVKIGGQYLDQLEYQKIEDYEITGLPAARPASGYAHYKGSMSHHDKVYENVVDVLNNSGVIAANGFEGLKTVEIIDKIYSAARHA